MVGVKSVIIDGETFYIFNSAIYIFESSTGSTLEVDMIVSEVTLRKYKDRESLIAEIELEDGRVISSFMFLKSLPGRLPRLNLFCELDESENYEGVLRISENDLAFPDIEEGITLEDIRKVEMPNEKITLKLNLPIDQVEWLREQKNRDLNLLFKELLYKHFK
ncbi:hypothetical protein DFO73_102339 [Cytobacillus oceanisediminis]|uniref:Uncharacterized protein n=1 Tax=Cytobacillus oceanisediminis TaxID=665099 RepID=A0A2V3A8U3_9BACI|nr:hypothetical protein [Cytobacillus oceanisediminis]PWW31343.1 hypothetical protein DFO73_102339 [Cytobacillus oceanisediminis]